MMEIYKNEFKKWFASSEAQGMALSVARILIGTVFFYSGFSKLTHPIEYFEVVVGQYDLIPDKIIHVVCLVLPWFEFVGGTFLCVGHRIPQTAKAMAILTAIFQIVSWYSFLSI